MSDGWYPKAKRLPIISGEMSPGLAPQKIAHGHIIYMIFVCQLQNICSTRVECADLKNLSISKFGEPMLLTFWSALTALRHFITHVVSVGAKKQVLGVHAGRIVALVTHKKTLWNRAYTQLVSNTLCGYRPPANFEVAMPACTLRGGPKPATFGLGYFGPKANSERGTFNTFCVVPTDVSHGLPLFTTEARKCLRSNRRYATATAFTEFRGIGYTNHVISLLIRLIANPRPFAAVRGLFMPNYSINVRRNGGLAR